MMEASDNFIHVERLVRSITDQIIEIGEDSGARQCVAEVVTSARLMGGSESSLQLNYENRYDLFEVGSVLPTRWQIMVR